jgi:hypothetical protein
MNWQEAYQLAAEFEPWETVRRARRRRAPTLDRVLRLAHKAGAIPTRATVAPDGKIELEFGTTAVATNGNGKEGANEWDSIQ